LNRPKTEQSKEKSAHAPTAFLLMLLVEDQFDSPYHPQIASNAQS
jgi:hypothetical protein